MSVESQKHHNNNNVDTKKKNLANLQALLKAKL